jgi:hypothetical protein
MPVGSLQTAAYKMNDLQPVPSVHSGLIPQYPLSDRAVMLHGDSIALEFQGSNDLIERRSGVKLRELSWLAVQDNR